MSLDGYIAGPNDEPSNPSLLSRERTSQGTPEGPSEKAPEPNPGSRAFTLGRGFRTRPGSMSRFALKRNQRQTDAVTVGHETRRRGGADEPASERAATAPIRRPSLDLWQIGSRDEVDQIDVAYEAEQLLGLRLTLLADRPTSSPFGSRTRYSSVISISSALWLITRMSRSSRPVMRSAWPCLASLSSGAADPRSCRSLCGGR